jgi:hypothetical protein
MIIIKLTLFLIYHQLKANSGNSLVKLLLIYCYYFIKYHFELHHF